MSHKKNSEMSARLQKTVGGLHLAAIVQVRSMQMFEISDTEREVHIDCRGLDWDEAFPLGLYFYGGFSDNEIGAMRNLYAPEKILRIEGPYSVLMPEDGGITVYDSKTTEIPEEDVEWLKTHLGTSIKLDVTK